METRRRRCTSIQDFTQEIYVSVGKKIEQGDPLMRVDVAAVRSEYLEKKLEQKN